MKIKAFADSQGISIDRMNRAAIWAFEQSGRPKPGRGTGGRYGGVQLTLKEQELCLQYLAEHGKGKVKAPEPLRYEQERLGWLQKWVAAYEFEDDGRAKGAILAVIGGLLCAKDRAWLDGACEGARNGDLLVELAYSAGVDLERIETTDSRGHGTMRGSKWEGFTRYLLDNGFESPGWDIL